MGDEQRARSRANWQDEVESAYLYRALATTVSLAGRLGRRH